MYIKGDPSSGEHKYYLNNSEIQLVHILLHTGCNNTKSSSSSSSSSTLTW